LSNSVHVKFSTTLIDSSACSDFAKANIIFHINCKSDTQMDATLYHMANSFLLIMPKC